MSSFLFTAKSANAKTGPMPVTTSSNDTCPSACPFRGNGCYAESGNLGSLWAKLSRALPGQAFRSGVATVVARSWDALCAAVAALPAGTLWRHNQAGDLPHVGGDIDAVRLGALCAANAGKRGFTYTHHDMTRAHNQGAILAANEQGFTVNLSANTLAHADELAALEIAPVVVVLPRDASPQSVATPAGRRVVVCPATYRDDVTCKTCALCAVVARQVIVGFPAHGARARAATAVCGK